MKRVVHLKATFLFGRRVHIVNLEWLMGTAIYENSQGSQPPISGIRNVFDIYDINMHI